MAKKHWIYLKRGLSENPKHRASMGECIWLYMHIIDRADWETGIAYDWKDAEEANDMGMSVDTLRRQRQKLVDNGYIKCELKQHSQNIYIYEWKNPRDYGSDTKNPRIQGSHQSIPSEIQGLNQGLNEGSNQGLNQVPLQATTPTSDSISLSISSSTVGEVFSLFENNIGPLTGILADKIGDAIDEYPEQWIKDAIQEAVTHNARNWAYIDRILRNWQANGRKNDKPIDGMSDIDKELIRRGIKTV